MAGLRVGIVGAGGVGIATAGALMMQGLAGRVTLYDRTGIRARGEALDYLHALPLLPSAEIRGRSYDEFEPEDVMIITCGHHIQPGETRLDVLEANVEILAQTATAI
jgi:L-lactate dehydrogenase